MVKLVLSAAALGLIALGAADVQAQELRTWDSARLAAPMRAAEITVATGYTQPFGLLEGSTGMPRVASPGLSVDLGVGYRPHPHWSFGVTGQYYELVPERADTTRGMSFSMNGSYHFLPERRVDPWLQLSSGYRFLWENVPDPAPGVLWHGFKVGGARLGFDVRASEEVAIAPFIGADMNVFLWNVSNGNSTAIADVRLSTFVFAGVQGRFDLGGTKVGGVQITSAPLSK